MAENDNTSSKAALVATGQPMEGARNGMEGGA